jgi:hypothetical protein
MSASSSSTADDPSFEGGAMPGARLLGLVQLMLQTGMAMARGINRIARQRLEGQDLARMAPAGFNATATSGLIVQAVAWTAALRERLLALAGRPSFVPRSGSRSGTRSPKGQGAPRGRGTSSYLPETVPEPTEGDWHDWRELARPWRMGPSGVAVATRMIAGLSNAEVVARICAKLSQAAAQLGADADVGRIAEMEAAARALCPDVEAAPDEAGDSGGDAAGASGASGGWEAASPPCGAATEADGKPPPKPPD